MNPEKIVVHPSNLAIHAMSVRDYFAAKALQSLILSKPYYDLVIENRQAPNYYATDAYQLADAMIVERNKHLPADKPTCRWTYDERENAWNTQCDKAQHSKRNGARFCQYCGGQIIEIANKSQE